VDGASDLRNEYVVAVTGTVRARLEGTTNTSLPTGDIEIGRLHRRRAERGRAAAVPDRRSRRVRRVHSVRYRYLDLRRDRMQKNLRVRATINSAVRRAMKTRTSSKSKRRC